MLAHKIGFRVIKLIVNITLKLTASKQKKKEKTKKKGWMGQEGCALLLIKKFEKGKDGKQYYECLECQKCSN